MSPKIYVVEGYNKNDYISGIINWETLFVSSNMEAIDNYILNIPENYILRIQELNEPISQDLDNKHWEIYTGV